MDGLTSGRILQISDFEIGRTLFKTVASILEFLFILEEFSTANRLSNSQ